MRRSGQTFRAVLEALKTASGGKEVFLTASHGRRNEERIFDMARTLCSSVLGDDMKYDRNRLVIRFPNGGHVHFSTVHHATPSLRGRDAEFVHDNS